MKNAFYSLFATIGILFYGCSTVKTTLDIRNYINTDINVNIESYNNKGSLKVNRSFVIEKADTLKKYFIPDTIIITKGYKNGNIKIKYNPTLGQSRFTLDPIQIPNSKDDINQAINITGLTLYSENDNKQKLLEIGTNLNFNKDTKFTRLVDITPQLASLIIGHKENDKLQIKEIIPLGRIEIKYVAPNYIEENSIIDKSTMAQLKVSVPVYGSVESKMSNNVLNEIKFDVKYYNYFNNTSFSTLISQLDSTKKRQLISELRLFGFTDKIWLIRKFDVIESGVFAITKGSKILTDSNAGIASVFTANAAYAFRAEDTQIVSISDQTYNLEYVEWQTVGQLIFKLTNNNRIDSSLTDMVVGSSIINTIEF
jgi:hypothetical protein